MFLWRHIQRWSTKIYGLVRHGVDCLCVACTRRPAVSEQGPLCTVIQCCLQLTTSMCPGKALQSASCSCPAKYACSKGSHITVVVTTQLQWYGPNSAYRPTFLQLSLSQRLFSTIAQLQCGHVSPSTYYLQCPQFLRGLVTVQGI